MLYSCDKAREQTTKQEDKLLDSLITGEIENIYVQVHARGHENGRTGDVSFQNSNYFVEITYNKVLA